MMATSVEAILGAVHLDGGDLALAVVMGKLGLTSDLLVMSTTLSLVYSKPLYIYNSNSLLFIGSST
jgi:ribonuclease-3